MKNLKLHRKDRRKARIKGKMLQDKPRLVVYRSLTSNYAQLVDDVTHKTLASVSDLKATKGTKTENAKNIGLEIAKKAKELKIEECVFDRNGLKYHGRVKAIADGAREGGLKF